jgi:hypothetical protein
MRAIKMLKRKSLAVPVRDLKDLKNFQGFGDSSEEEERTFVVSYVARGTRRTRNTLAYVSLRVVCRVSCRQPRRR